MEKLKNVIAGLFSTVPLDGRRLEEATAEPTMLQCIEKLQNGTFGAVSRWLLHMLMFEGWGHTDAVQRAIDNFHGSAVDALFLRALQNCLAYGVVKDRAAAFLLFKQGVELEDPSGRCHSYMGLYLQHGYGTNQNLKKSVELYREGIARSCAFGQSKFGYCFFEGILVQQDFTEAARLLTLSHLQGNPTASSSLAVLYNHGGGVTLNPAIGVALSIDATSRGDPSGVATLLKMQAANPSSVVPFSYWRPLRHVHRWVGPQIDLEMVCLLMAKKRKHGFINTLPPGIVLMICFYLCCRPNAIEDAQISTRNQNGEGDDVERDSKKQKTSGNHMAATILQ